MRFLLFIPILLAASTLLTTWSLLRWWHRAQLATHQREQVWHEPTRDDRLAAARQRLVEQRLAAVRAAHRADEARRRLAAFQAAEDARIAAARAQPAHDWVETLPAPWTDAHGRAA